MGRVWTATARPTERSGWTGQCNVQAAGRVAGAIRVRPASGRPRGGACRVRGRAWEQSLLGSRWWGSLRLRGCGGGAARAEGRSLRAPPTRDCGTGAWPEEVRLLEGAWSKDRPLNGVWAWPAGLMLMEGCVAR